MSMLQLRYTVPGDDFTRAGEASGDVKHKLKKLGYNPSAIRRVSIAMYEGEINMVIHAGGGEANVAVSLANYGMDAEFLTVLPQNDIADACIRELRYFGVDTKKIVRGEGRMGIYYLEGGANQLPSKVVYDLSLIHI